MQTRKKQPANKASFVLHIDSLDILDELDDTQTANLFRAIRSFQTGNEFELDAITKIAFLPFKNQFIRDNIAYKEMCERNKQIAENRNNKQPLATERNDSLPGVTYNDSDSVNENEKEKDSESDKENDTTHSHFLNFDFHKTDYTNLPIELQSKIESNVWQSWQAFNQHIDKECKRIRQIPEQINFTDYLEYKDRYIKSGLFDTLKLKTMLSKFNNCKSNQRYISVFTAIIDWTEREIEYLGNRKLAAV